MGLFQASFRIRHECPYRELSERHPDLTIREWYMNDCQVLEITAPETPHESLLEDIHRLGEVLYESDDATGLHMVMQSCLCALEGSIIERIEAHNALYQPPTVHRHGWEHYTVVAFDEGHIRELYADLEAHRDIEVLSKTGLDESQLPGMIASIDQLFDGLTDRQLDAVRLALDHGYYQQPRQSSVSDLAAETAVARSTYEEHLRKAENKLLTNVGQFVRLLGGTETEGALGRAPDGAAPRPESD